jgi:hypothetical protein
MGTIKTTNIEPIADNGTVTLGSSGDTFTLGSGVVQSNLNYPAFEAYGSSDQTASDNTWTKLNMNTEILDTNSMYNTSTYRFTPTVSGKYYVYGHVAMYSNTNYQLQIPNLAIYKNGSEYKHTPQNFGTASPPNEVSIFLASTIDFNGSSDYVELYARGNVISGVPVFEIGSAVGVFGAYRIGS